MNKINIKQKAWKVKTTLKFKYNQAKNWAIQNPEKAAVIFTTSISAGAYLSKAAIKNVNLRKQEAVKILYCYDRSLGHYWRLKRELSNREWLEIDRRKREGEKLAEILDSMKVLK